MSFLDFSQGVFLAVPDEDALKKSLDAPPQPFAKTTLRSYRIVDDGFVPSFSPQDGGTCPAYIYRVSYHELLAYQRYISLSHYSERIVQIDEVGEALVYALLQRHDNPPLMNPTLEDFLTGRSLEWGFIPDVHAFFPVEYASHSLIEKKSVKCEGAYQYFLDDLRDRTAYESGVKKSVANADDSIDFKQRIRRYYLGKIKIKLDVDRLIDDKTFRTFTYGQPAYVDLFISLDTQSHCGVVTFSAFSLPFLISMFMDRMINNQLMAFDDKLGWVNFFDYLSERLSVFKRGSVKMYLTAPYAKDYLPKNQLASLLMSELIYPLEEGYGEFVDDEIIQIVSSENGMGQYSRGSVYAYSNVLIQLGDSPKTTVRNRMLEESVTFFYIELLVFEEASIEIANHSILKSIASKRGATIFKSLMDTHQAYCNFTDSMIFWNVQMNYPSSKKSVEMIREAFKIEKTMERYERNQGELQMVFDTKRDIIDRMESSILNYIILFLTILQCLPAFFPDQILPNSALDRAAKLTILVLLLLLYNQIKNYTLNRRFASKKRRKRKRKNS